jgi:exopolysaccharide biosynthesis polyprenyl glycosylphosphotransferase
LSPRLAGLSLGGKAGAARWTWQATYVRHLIAVDLLIGAATSATAFAVHQELFDGYRMNRYALISAALVLAWLAVLAVCRAYETRLLFMGSDEYQRVIRAGFALLTAVAIFAYLTDARLSRGYVALVVTGYTVCTLAGRLVLRRRLYRARRGGACMRRVLVLGHADAVRDMTRKLHRQYYHGLQVVGSCLPAHQFGTYSAGTYPLAYGRLEDAPNAVMAARADAVIVLSCPELSGTDLRRLAWQLERDNVDLIVASSLQDVAGDRVTVRPIDGLPMLYIEHPKLTGPKRAVKTVIDCSAAAFMLTLLLPLFATVALVIKLTSSGPVFFRQVRVGKNGETFPMLKFRSMYTDAEIRLTELRSQNEQDGVLFKMRNDPRVTPIGRFIRRFSIDELPQLVNILLGDMSLVGPRPPLPDEVAQYPRDMRRRLVVKPGLTGLWQVSGRSDLSWEDTIRLDLWYVENWSLSLDVTILLRTASAVWRGSGAY